MLVSMKWLKTLVDVDLATAELVERLDMTGTAVEAVRGAGASLAGVVVGQVLTKEKHPEADKLWVTTVDIGADEPLTIVCGAQNFDAGDKVPVATVGAVLPNGMRIEKAKLRGIVSFGMNCSAAELGLGEDASGLLVLPADAPVGVPFAEYRGMSDTVLELEVTPNRPDCLSMAGVAREVGAVLGVAASLPAQTPAETGAPAADRASVTIEDPDLCPRYTARLITGVSIGPSPEWLAERVTGAGARPINNIVDITNYVMFELGQPLHAFDARTLGVDGGKASIVVRRAREGEKMTTLDGQERSLAEGMLLICDPTGPVALGGVMGGGRTEVSEGTVDILLESACFQPASIGLTSRGLGLISEASTRFERGVDPNGCVAALDRAAALMAEIAGGEVAPGVIDVYPRPADPRPLELRIDRLNAVLGTSIAAEEAARILVRLGLGVTGGGDVLAVTVPTFRPDLVREIDLVEEVARVWGMDRVPGTLPAGRGRVGALTVEQRRRDRMGSALRAAGLNQTMTYSFVDPEDLARLGWELAEDELQVELMNPMSSEQSVMRTTLAPGLLRSVSYNQRRGVEDVHLYELGTVFVSALGRKLPRERASLAGVLAGSWSRPGWNDAGTPLDFFDGKGVIASLMEELGIARWQVRPAEHPHLQPGRSADVLVGGEVCGWIGEVHPLVLERYEAHGPVTLFELAADELVRRAVEVGEY
ncbi:MAG: phenylalanine--tRNA ligase subunit beta, partial [Coriobacteriaceae bacterium]|nr:phenylalanine--tRNA ligase subunit beta [Coriobacteriaceae bacterium]